MQRKFRLLAAFVALLFAAPSFAQQPKSSPPAKSGAQKQQSTGDFRRVMLGGDPDLSIEVPANRVLRQHALDIAAKPNGELLYFLFGDNPVGFLSCDMRGVDYAKDENPAVFQKCFGGRERNICLSAAERENGGTPRVIQAESFKHRGDPALGCAVSCTAKTKKGSSQGPSIPSSVSLPGANSTS